jgi:hypothetical protein
MGGMPAGPSMQSNQRLQRVLALYEEVEAIVGRYSSRRKICSAVILFLSVITSGALWLLLGNLAPHATLWLGAIASTITTVITLYVYSSGMIQTIANSLTLYKTIGRFVARLRSEPLSDGEYWDRVKGFEFELQKLRAGQTQDI